MLTVENRFLHVFIIHEPIGKGSPEHIGKGTAEILRISPFHSGTQMHSDGSAEKDWDVSTEACIL